MTKRQRDSARHALGLPNKTNFTTRNYFCTGEGSDDFEDWQSLVTQGLAIRRTSPHFGGDFIYHLTINAAKSVLLPKEHLSRENAEQMRGLSSKESA